MEPNYFASNILALVVPFLCYYFGILIRKMAIPGKESPSLKDQFLLGVPVSLIVVSPMLPVIATAYSNPPAVLVMLGIIMEHGMLVNETATLHLKKLGGRI